MLTSSFETKMADDKDKCKSDLHFAATFTSLQKGELFFFPNRNVAEKRELLFPAREGGNDLSKAG
jgi:hypothetical protein